MPASPGCSRWFCVGATDATKHASIEDYLAVISDAVATMGGRVNLAATARAAGSP
jgi:hypothetical protein